MSASDEQRLTYRQVEAINDSIDSNQRSLANIEKMTADLHVAMYGNGKVEQSVRYRVAWSERQIKMLIVAILSNALMTVILALIMIFHIVV